jgi:O-antigen/teichoic acid export membrane protein
MNSETASGPGFARRIAAGASLFVLGNLGARLLGIVSLGVLGRLLTPDDFGIIAITMLVIGISDALMSRQFDLALIRTREIDRQHFDTAFTLSLSWGLLAGGAIFALSGWIALLLDTPALGSVLKWLAVAPVIEGLRNPRFVEFERGLAFLPDTLVNLGAKTLQIAVAIGLAALLRNYWAMVAGYLAFVITRLVLGYLLRPYRPGLSLRHFREFLSFGGWIGGTGLLGLLIQKSDVALIGATLGTAVVGIYNIGSELTLTATQYLAGPVARAVYPGLSAVAGDPARLRRGYYRAQEILMGILLPLGIGTALVAREAVLVLVGAKWEAAIPVLQILAPVSAVSLVVFNIQSLLMVDGSTRSMFGRNLAVAAFQIPAIALGLWSFGLAGAIVARALALLLHIGLSLKLAARLTGDPALATFLVVWRSIAAAAAMAAGVLLLAHFQAGADSLRSLLANGAEKALLGMLLYPAAHLALWAASGRPEGFETAATGLARRLLRRLLPGRAGLAR